jgi:hypothetical protein
MKNEKPTAYKLIEYVNIVDVTTLTKTTERRHMIVKIHATDPEQTARETIALYKADAKARKIPFSFLKFDNWGNQTESETIANKPAKPRAKTK